MPHKLNGIGRNYHIQTFTKIESNAFLGKKIVKQLIDPIMSWLHMKAIAFQTF